MPGDDELIQRAIDAIGPDDGDDWKLVPSSHPTQLRDSAPALASLFESDELRSLARRYEDDDASALQAQEEFRRASRQLNLAILATAVLGALMLATGVAGPLIPAWAQPAANGLLLTLGLASLGVGAFAAMRLHQLSAGDLAGAYLRLRAEAEQARLAYFARVVTRQPRQSVAAGPGAIPLALLKLEYFRRFQLGVQRAYFAGRGRQHATDARHTLGLGALAVGLSSVAASAGGVLGATFRPWLSLAALGAVAVAVSSFAAAGEAMGQDRDRAERYRNTLVALDKVALRLEEVRDSAARNETAALDDFVAAVHEQLSLEHRQFLAGGDGIRGALAKLEATLDEARTQRGGQAAPGGAPPAGAAAGTAAP